MAISFVELESGFKERQAAWFNFVPSKDREEWVEQRIQSAHQVSCLNYVIRHYWVLNAERMARLLGQDSEQFQGLKSAKLSLWVQDDVSGLEPLTEEARLISQHERDIVIDDLRILRENLQVTKSLQEKRFRIDMIRRVSEALLCIEQARQGIHRVPGAEVQQ